MTADTDDVDSAPATRTAESSQRRLVADGFALTLEQRDGTWCLADETEVASELKLLSALGRNSGALPRARGVIAALNSNQIELPRIGTLNRRMATLRTLTLRGYWRVPITERDPLTVACAQLDSEPAWDWLVWTLSKRLETSLRATPWRLPGPHGWRGAYPWEFDGRIAQRLGHKFWEQLQSHPEPHFRQLAVATDPRADPEQLAQLAQCDDPGLLDLVAVNPATPPDTLRNLAGGIAATQNRFELRLRVLQNPSTPASQIAAAAVAPTTHPDRPRRAETSELIRQATHLCWAVSHPRAPKALFAELAWNPAPWVRVAVAEARRTPRRILSVLAAEPTSLVRATVAANTAAPACVLEELGTDPLRRVRAGVAANTAAPPAVLCDLATDRVAAVRQAVASNTTTPADLLRELAQDTNNRTAAAATSNLSNRPSEHVDAASASTQAFTATHGAQP